MGRDTLYAYADGNDLSQVETQILDSLRVCIYERNWVGSRPRIVNQRHDGDETLGQDDLPDWDLGINLELPDPGAEPPDWFSNVEAVAQVCASTGHPFVIGVATQAGVAEDLFFVDSRKPDLVRLRAVLECGDDPAD